MAKSKVAVLFTKPETVFDDYVRLIEMAGLQDALDPTATFRIEELMLELVEKYTIVIVTHNMYQASRVSKYTGFFLLGELIEYGPTVEIFESPQDRRTDDYVRGRFG